MVGEVGCCFDYVGYGCFEVGYVLGCDLVCD